MRHSTASALLLLLSGLGSAASNCGQIEQVSITFYGFPDNTPPGSGIECEIESRGECSADYGACIATNSSSYAGDSYSSGSSPPPAVSKRDSWDMLNFNTRRAATNKTCGPRGETAGGTGTYEDPLTMASSGKWFCHQEIIYLPYVQKYLRYEDYCKQCIADAANANKPPHIDLWTGSNKVNGGKMQVRCENSLTPDGLRPMIRNPPQGLPVDTSSLFIPNGDTGLCNGTTVQQSVGRVAFDGSNSMRLLVSMASLYLLIHVCLMG